MQLYVGGLADDTTDDELNGLCAAIGVVEFATIVRDIASGMSRGFGIVRMPSDADGEEAIKQLNGTMLKGRQIVVTRMPETLPGEMEFREWLRENTLAVLRKVGVSMGQTVLDYGCGSGIFTIPAAQIVGQEGKVYAFEVRPHALERVREEAGNKGLGNIETVLLDRAMLTTGLPGESVDVILVYDVMHEVEDKSGLLEELHRVLKGDGLLSIFPMHLGTDRMLEVMDKCDLFCFRDNYSPPKHKAASEILNFEKC
ncbi:methyltransferase domain-containing protein [Chloroflexota bacterium]